MSKKSKWDSSSGSDNDDNDIVNDKKIRNGANKKIKTSINFENSNSVDDNNNIDRSVIKIDGIDIMNKSSGSKTLDVTSHVNNNNNDLDDMNVISSENIIVFNDGIDQQLKCDSDEVKLQYDLTADKDVIDPVSNNSDENINAVTLSTKQMNKHMIGMPDGRRTWGMHVCICMYIYVCMYVRMYVCVCTLKASVVVL